MAVNRSTRDTLTSCNPELYDNIYQVSKRADLKPSKVQSLTSKDTLERSAATEAMNRLQRPSENMIFEPNVLFRRIGKYVFLTVAMPPYFLLYGLPKWLIVEGFQVLAVAMTWLSKELQEKTQKPLNLIKHKVNQLVFFMRMLVNRTIQPVADLAIKLRQFFQGMAYRFIQINANIFQRTKSLLKKPGEIAKNLAQNLSKRWASSKKWVREQTLSISEKIGESANWIKQTPQLFLGWGAARIQQLTQLEFGWREKVVSKFKVSSKAARICSDWVAQQASVLKDLMKKAVTPFPRLYLKSVKPLLQTISKALQSSWNKFSGFLNDRKNGTLTFLETLQNKVKSLTPQYALDKLLPASFLARLPAMIRNLLIKIKQSAFLYAFCRLGLNGLKFVVVNSTLLLKKSIEGVSNFYTAVSRQLHSLKQQVKKVLQQSLKNVQKGIDYIQKCCKNGLHGILVVIFMAGILLKWGFESLGEITTQWASKFSFFNRNNSNKSG